MGEAGLADALDALPRELAVWHDGPTVLAKLLTHCTLERLVEEAKLLRSGIGPGLLHPDAEIEDPAYSEHRDRWSHAVSTIVDWHGRLCHTEPPHAFPVLGNRNLNDIQPSTIQGWLRTLTDLAPSYRQIIFANVSTVFTAAVDDALIVANPCRARSVRLPKRGHHKVVPWTRGQVLAVRGELPPRYQLMVWLGAGLGMRQGEIFGLSPEDIDIDRGEVHVRRQVKLVGNEQMLGLTKGRKVRDIPLPDAVLEAINAHMTAYPPIEVTPPWDRTDGKPTTFSLLLYSREKKALGRNYINSFIWKPALKRAGVPVTRETGSHALRHFYASSVDHHRHSPTRVPIPSIRSAARWSSSTSSARSPGV